MDKSELVLAVVDSIGVPVYGFVDENNDIVLNGTLSNGTYTLKYEDAEGNLTSIGTIEIDSSKPAYVNLIPISINSDGTPYNNGQGWKTGYRLNSSGVEKEATDNEVTGFISAKYGDIVYLQNVNWNRTVNSNYIWCYDSSFNPITYMYGDEINSTIVNSGGAIVGTDNILNAFIVNETFFTKKTSSDLASVAYIRLSCAEISNNSIITVNEPIE